MEERDYIEVTEAVYKAATSFDELVDGEGFLLAEELVKLYERAGNEKMIVRWREIRDYLKTREFSAAGVRVILETQ